MITASEIKLLKSRDDKPDGRDTSTNSYRPILRFQYTIDDREYKSDLLRPSEIVQGMASRASAEQVIAPYPLGQKVPAYYQPAWPDKAFLLAESSAGPIVFIILGLLLGPVVWIVGKWIF